MDQSELDPTGPYLYDLVDITRQMISNLFYDVTRTYGSSYNRFVTTVQELPSMPLIFPPASEYLR